MFLIEIAESHYFCFNLQRLMLGLIIGILEEIIKKTLLLM